MTNKRISIFSGHYGSGKTNIAVNYAVYLKRQGNDTSIYDLDIVNPYFRTVDANSQLIKEGVNLIVSPYAETNVDIPAMNSASYKMVDDLSERAVVDLGGDDRGALALGRFADKIKQENNYSMFFVVNVYRPETRDLEGLLQIKQEIETVSKIPFTGIVNNSNLGKETTVKTVLDSVKLVKEFSKITNLPVEMTTCREDLVLEIEKKEKNILPLKLIEYGKWL